MPSSLKAIFRFARLGFGVTAAFFCYQFVIGLATPRTPNPAVMLGFVFLCPPSLLSIFFRGVEFGTRDSYFLWTLIAVLNAVLYGGVRALVFALKRDSTGHV